jgi:structure-specific recognition protein 1
MFDMKVMTKSPSLFSGIDRDELENLTSYFQSKKINVKRIQEELQKVTFQESDEEEMDADDSRQQ